jgi:hypothetical protein
MTDQRTLIRDFVAAWRRGNTEAAHRIKKVAWAQHREDPMSEATLSTIRTIYDVESMIPLGPVDNDGKDTR